ncbi:hypothetical protein CKO_00628 [Citrobacter koseri ATCC BAA-895]|uniref:Uncharacterized protein n=1 Tax=Citrobacter koseri (strain ATCC BAA-895 / CDC 4225-83 / SGSC4696) TaxID=290338 RepID=A8AE69_CITK8|nr:hypothetical protein CKO_00628 [Citrobacter koseri ATCC BAA-895]
MPDGGVNALSGLQTQRFIRPTNVDPVGLISVAPSGECLNVYPIYTLLIIHGQS